MGILHKLVWVLQKVDPENKEWFESIIKRLPDYAQAEMRKKLEGENWDYLRKLGIIQQSVYGVDIQPIAIQIAKLRFFISLLVDQDIKGNVENNFGLQPLPNLDFKLVAANTLIGAPEQSQQSEGKSLFGQDVFFDAFNKLTGQYFGTYEPAEKKKLTKKIEKLVSGKVQEKLNEIQQLGTHTDERFSKHVAEKNKAAIEQKKRDAKLWESYNNLFKHESVGFFEIKYFFPEVKEGFDVVIGNPPYVSVKSISSDDKFVLSKEFDTGQCRFNLFTLFLEKGHKLLSLNGILTFIIPESIYSHVEYRHTRNYLLNNASIVLINLFSNKVFEAAVDTTILSIKNSKDNQGNFCVYRDLRNKVFELNQKLFQDYPFNLFAVNLTSQSFNIIDRFINNKSFDILEQILEIQQGIIYSGQPKNKVFANLSKDKTFQKVLDGRDILKWRINWDDKIDNKYISYTAKLHRPREERLFIAKEKILLPRKSTKISCAYDDKQFYALNTAYICLLKNAVYNLKYILSLLNSKFINFFYSSLFLGWQITIPALNTLPIKKIEEDRQQPFITLVDQILAAKQPPSSPFSKGELLVADTSALEKQIDEMVYALYGLTPEEIAIVEGSTSGK